MHYYFLITALPKTKLKPWVAAVDAAVEFTTNVAVDASEFEWEQKSS